MTTTEAPATGLAALDAQILLAESRLVERELLVRGQCRRLVTRANDSLVRRLGQGALALAGALLLGRWFRPPAAAAQAAEAPRAPGLGTLLMQLVWPALPQLLRSHVSPALALSLLSGLWSRRHRTSNKPTEDPP
nr:hypothetical protein [uncultured Roseateles sp.]